MKVNDDITVVKLVEEYKGNAYDTSGMHFLSQFIGMSGKLIHIGSPAVVGPNTHLVKFDNGDMWRFKPEELQ